MTVLLSVHFEIKNLKPNIHEAFSTLFDSGLGTIDKAGSFLSYRPFLLIIAAHCPSLSSHLTMTPQDLLAHAMVLAYRMAGYALDNLVEDAALLALIFC